MNLQQQFRRYARVSSVAVWKWMDQNQPMGESYGQIIPVTVSPPDLVGDIVAQVSNCLGNLWPWMSDVGVSSPESSSPLSCPVEHATV